MEGSLENAGPAKSEGILVESVERVFAGARY
jgi:hypothetical protein